METVNKPWGYEKWIHQGRFVTKIIFMHGGKRCSRQYHKEKEEVNVIISGVCEVELNGKKTSYKSGDYFIVMPNTVHRVKAITDLLMAESSTLELDDVIRVEDDYSRPDGRIESEHE